MLNVDANAIKKSLLMILFLMLGACGSRQTYQSTYQPAYTPNNYYASKAVKPYVAKKQSVNLTFEELARFQYDCSRRIEQLDLLDDQIRRRKFYRVDGVEGNEFSDRISKRYYALARYRIWSLRLGCRGSSVDPIVQIKLKRASTPNRPPEISARCYFKESVEAITQVGALAGASENVVSKRKEICTNYPLMGDAKIVQIGDVVDPVRELEENISYIPNLRKWNGNIFQVVSKTEMHLREIVKFTVVLMWNGKAWVVADKF
jgi:hypothetical protein